MIRTTHKRINITLPSDTIQLIDRVAEKGDRSRFINEAARYYVREAGKAKLRKFLKEGAVKHAERDLTLAGEWFQLEHEAWQKGNHK